MFVKNIGKKTKKKIKEEINDCEFIKKRIIFDKISDFQDCNELYPEVYSNYYNEIHS